MKRRSDSDRMTRNIAPAARWIGCCLLGITFGLSSGTAKSDPSLSAAIAPQPLTAALADFARQTGLQLVYVTQIVAGRASKGALAGLSAAADRARALPAPAIDRLEYLIRSSVDVLEAELPYVTLLLRVRGNTEVERAALDQRRAFDRFVAELVAQAVRDGDIRPDVDAMITARLLFGLVNSLVEWDRPARRAATGPLADALCAMVFDGLRTRRGSPRSG